MIWHAAVLRRAAVESVWRINLFERAAAVNIGLGMAPGSPCR